MDAKAKYGQEMGKNLKRIAQKLIGNQELCCLLVNTDLDPLNKDTHPDTIDGLSLLNKNIRVVPYLDSSETDTQSKIVLVWNSGEVSTSNSSNERLSLQVGVYCPFKEWLITGDDLRPYAIMAEIRKTLQDRRINGLGEIRYESFNLNNLTEEASCYMMNFSINEFS